MYAGLDIIVLRYDEQANDEAHIIEYIYILIKYTTFHKEPNIDPFLK